MKNLLDKVSLMLAGAAIAMVVNVGITYAQAPTVDQGYGSTWLALALSIMSLVSQVANFYLAQKAKTVGSNPNSTDERLAKYIVNLADRTAQQEDKLKQFADFLYEKAVPEQAKQIAEGSLPKIKIENLNSDVEKAKQDLATGISMFETIQADVKKQ